MLAMIVDADAHILRAVQRPVPQAFGQEVLVRVLACGVCRTDLHVIDGDLPVHMPEVIPGHEIVGRIVSTGPLAGRFKTGQRVGIPWLGRSCGACAYCAANRENLCDAPAFTGYDRDGGFAQYTVADERFCFALPESFSDAHAAPLLCAGLIGYRAWRLAGGAAVKRLGLYGFGAAAHIICQVAVAQGQQVYAFTRAGDVAGQEFARSLGAVWSGGSGEMPPHQLDAALIFAPIGSLVPASLAATAKGGSVVCAGIHMSPIPAFDYALLWGERTVKSVANLTRSDGKEFFELLTGLQLQTHVECFALADANAAVDALRAGSINGAAVLIP